MMDKTIDRLSFSERVTEDSLYLCGDDSQYLKKASGDALLDRMRAQNFLYRIGVSPLFSGFPTNIAEPSGNNLALANHIGEYRVYNYGSSDAIEFYITSSINFAFKRPGLYQVNGRLAFKTASTAPGQYLTVSVWRYPRSGYYPAKTLGNIMTYYGPDQSGGSTRYINEGNTSCVFYIDDDLVGLPDYVIRYFSNFDFQAVQIPYAVIGGNDTVSSLGIDIISVSI